MSTGWPPPVAEAAWVWAGRSRVTLCGWGQVHTQRDDTKAAKLGRMVQQDAGHVERARRDVRDKAGMPGKWYMSHVCVLELPC